MAFPSLLVWAVSSPAMAYVYYGVIKLPRGCIRLMAALPLLAFYGAVAKGFETVFERGVYSFFFLWLTSFKIVLLCWDLGPAADPWAVASFPRFLAVMTLSLQIKRQQFGARASKTIPTLVPPAAPRVVVAPDRESSTATRRTRGRGSHIPPSPGVHGGPRRSISTSDSHQQGCIAALLKRVDESQEMHTVVLRLLFKLVCIMAMTYAFTYRDSLPPALLYLLYSFYIYITCSLIFEGIAAVVSPVMGIELEPSFNKPFLAHSLADFWGQRWNLLVSNLLRVSIYDPLVRFLLGWRSREPGLGSSAAPCPSTSPGTTSTLAEPEPPLYAGYRLPLPLWVRSIAMFSCFLVSGLMHELIFHIMTRRKPTWEVTCFFVLNGAAALLEGALGRKTTLRLPKPVSAVLTLSFVLVTAILFFYPPLIDSGTADRAIAEFHYFFQTLYSVVGVTWLHVYFLLRFLLRCLPVDWALRPS